jgi:hypothetical protein
MRLARFEREAQRLPGPEQVALSYDIVECPRPQALGKRGRGLAPGEEIIH